MRTWETRTAQSNSGRFRVCRIQVPGVGFQSAVLRANVAGEKGPLTGNMRRFYPIGLGLLLAGGIFFGLSGVGDGHSGLVDGYGCHRGADSVSYHCHQGQFVGRTFKSKEDFLRQLRGGKSEHFSPRASPPQPPQPQKKLEE
jgi:hypothetical protein